MSLANAATEYVIERSIRARRIDKVIWPFERRQRYMLRDNTVIPLSIDPSVLPLVEPNTLASEAFPIVATVFVAANAISLLEREGRAKGETFDRSQVEHLGYDVCDDAKISALLNFGHTDEDHAALKQRWARALNEHHLFIDADDAAAFTAFAGQLYPEHSPLSLVGLYAGEALLVG
jgi:hypothetical protein